MVAIAEKGVAARVLATVATAHPTGIGRSGTQRVALQAVAIDGDDRPGLRLVDLPPEHEPLGAAGRGV